MFLVFVLSAEGLGRLAMYVNSRKLLKISCCCGFEDAKVNFLNDENLYMSDHVGFRA